MNSRNVSTLTAPIQVNYTPIHDNSVLTVIVKPHFPVSISAFVYNSAAAVSPGSCSRSQSNPSSLLSLSLLLTQPCTNATIWTYRKPKALHCGKDRALSAPQRRVSVEGCSDYIFSVQQLYVRYFRYSFFHYGSNCFEIMLYCISTHSLMQILFRLGCVLFAEHSVCTVCFHDLYALEFSINAFLMALASVLQCSDQTVHFHLHLRPSLLFSEDCKYIPWQPDP